MKEGKCNWRGIGSLVVIMVCLVSVMSPAMTQSSLSLFGNVSNGTNGETGDDSIPTPTPIPTLTPSPTPTPSLTPTPDPTSSPSPAPTPIPTHSPTPTPGPTSTLTPTPSPTPTLTPAPMPTPSPVPITPPTMTSFAPDSPVCDIEGATRTFNITTNQVVNVSWLLNGTEVQTNESVTEASYTNISPAVGVWNITAIASNENGTGMQTWVWNVSQQVTPTPSPIPTPSPTSGPTPSPSPITKSSPAPAPTQILSSNGKPSMPFYIYGWVYYENGDPCNNSIVNINNTNTSKQWQADTNASYNFYQLVLDTTNISAGNMLEFNTTDGTQSNVTKHVVTQSEINNGTIFNFNLTLPSAADTTPSEWSNPQKNKTPIYENDYVKFTANWTDDVALAGYKFSTNQSGAWVNSSFVPFSGTFNVSENITQITASAGITVGWRFYANDTSNNWNVTDNQSFVVQSAEVITPVTPFMIYGRVYEDGSECLGPTVNINNTNTSITWQAETNASYNFYQLILDTLNVSAGDVLKFNATDGTQFNVTNHVVTQSDINKGGLLDFNLTLPAAVDTTPPASITSLYNTTYEQTYINWSWTNPGDADFNYTMVYINGTWKENVSSLLNYSNATGLSPNTNNTISTHTVDTSGNVNQTWVNHSAWTAPSEDTTPPASITNLHNTTYAPTYINWSWTNPADGDFNHTMVYINGIWKENVSSPFNYSNATGLSPNTNNTISTHTVDTSGNVNLSWVNHSAWTAATSDTTPPEWRSQGQNVSQIPVGGSIILYAQGKDETALDFAILETNETGGWLNITDGSYDSPKDMGAATDWTWSNFTWQNSSISAGTTVGWMVWYNDTSDNWNKTEIMSFTVQGTQAPQWSDLRKNKTTIYESDYVKFNANWTDDVALAGYKFSINQRGTWVNSSFVPFSDTFNISENITQITAPAGTTAQWRFYANDTSDNWSVTDNRSFVVASPLAPPSSSFMIYGCVFYEDGSECLDPTVKINNTNTNITWQADTNASYNFYQLILDTTNISKDNMLEFNVTDGTQSNVTNHTVTQSDINIGGLFNVNLTLPTLPAVPPSIVSYAPETPVSDTKNATRKFNITVDQTVNVSWLINGTEAQPANISVNEASYTNASAVAGYWNVSAIATNANGTDIQTWWWTVTDIILPASISNLHNVTYEQTYINWSWTNPGDADFNYTMVYINGTWKENVSSSLNYSNATGLSPNTNNTISTHTVDTSGNVNLTWVNHSAWTAPSEDTTPPASITNLHNTTYEQTYINWSWTNPGDTDFNYTMVYINGTWKENVSSSLNYSDATGLSPNTNNTISTHTVDTSGNINLTWVNHSAWTAPSEDTAPPASITNLHNTTYASTYINWSWLNPADTDFNHTIVYINGIWKENVSSPFNYSNATGLCPDTSYEIATHTVDEVGNINETWVNQTTKTEPDIQAPQWSDPQTNKTPIYKNDYVKFTANWTDDVALAGYIFSINQTGTGENSSFVPFSDTSNTSENITQITAPAGTTVQWRFYANDTSDNWNVTVIKSFVVQSAEVITPVTPFMIYGRVFYEDEDSSECNNPTVNITNLNTSEELIADNHTESNFYQLVTNSTFVNASDVLKIEASKNETLVGNATHIINQTEIERGVIMVDINTGMPDLVISELGISIPPLLVNETNTINVTVWNDGYIASGEFNVSFSVSRENKTKYETETQISDGLPPKAFINVPFSWEPTSEGSYNITFSADSNNEIEELNESNNNLTMTVFVGVPDFTVTNIAFTPPEPLIGDVVKINATIANFGVKEDTTFVEFYDNKSIKIERRLADYLESPINDTITLPDVLKIRVHFESFDVSSDGYITIYNESRLLEELGGTGTDYWTEWCDGDTIRIESWNSVFTVDRYEAVLAVPANDSISLGAGNSTNISAVWNLSDQYMGWATSGTHNITVKVDPYNQVAESDEENNNKTEAIDVNPSLDFAVEEISLNRTEPLLGDVVGINANISNYGVRNGTTFVIVYYDNTSIEIERRIPHTSNSTDNISLPADVLGLRIHFSYYELTSAGYINIYDKDGHLVERIYRIGEKWGANWIGKDYWTDWIYSNAVRIEMYSGTGTTNFTINRYEALIANETVTLNASESKVINASWRTGAAYGGAGYHNVTVRVDPHDVFAENNKTNNNLSEPVFVNGTDLAVTNIDIPYSFEDPLYRTKVVNITATIANLGAIDASNFTVNFSYGYGQGNTSGVVFNTTNISFLGAGNFTNITTPWRIPETAELNYGTITVSIPFATLIDNNETNNMAYKNTNFVISQYDFSVENISVYPQEVREGEPVNVTVTIGNLGITSGNVCVGFYVNSTDFAAGDERFSRFGTTEPVYIEPGGTDTLSFSWNANVHGGSHFIFAVADPDDVFAETSKTGDDACNDTHASEGGTIYFKGDVCDTGNNVRNCTLHVIPPDLSLTNLSLDPAAPNSGDDVNITAEIKNNNETEQANSTVWFYMQSDESISGSSRGGHSGVTPWNWSSVLQPEDVPIRFHFDSIIIKQGGRLEAFINDSQGQRQPMYFYVKSEEAGGQLLKMPMIEYTTLGYTEHEIGTRGYYRQWNDVWTDWTEGTAVEIYAMAKYFSSVPFAQVSPSIDKYQVLLANKTITVNANESRVYNATWNTSFPLKPGKNYTVFATLENQTKSSDEIYLGGTDLAVTNISVKPVILDGNRVWINATIANFGFMNATNFNVTFTEVYVPSRSDPDLLDQLGVLLPDGSRTVLCSPVNHVKPINTTRIKKGLERGNSTTISFVPWNASIRDLQMDCIDSYGVHDSWIKYGADDYTITVAIEPLENHEQDDRTNNTLLRDVHVNRSRDFIATNLSFKVNNESLSPDPSGKVYLELYDNVTVNATVNITNLANQGGIVNLSFYIDEIEEEHEIGNTSVAFDAGNGTGYAEIDWKADNLYGDVYIPGDHNITVRVDPEKEIYEINDFDTEFPNNDFTWQIHVKAPELVFENFSIYPSETLEKGDSANINVTIANRGRLNTTSDFNFTIYDWAERHIDNVAYIEQYKGFPRIEVKRENATAMRLYLDLEIEELLDPEIEKEKGGEVCIYDSKSSELRCYNYSFHGWTPWMLENNITVETIEETTINRYLFSWDNVPGNESKRLITYFTDDRRLDWAENAEINKTDDNRTIHVFTAENNSANLTLGEHNETASLEINGVIVEDISLIVKERSGKLKIYNSETCDTDVYAQVSKVYYLMESDIINTTTHDLAINETANISVEWTASTVGERFIAAVIDPEDVIMEYNESNNMLARFISVQTADLEVSNLSLWLNGTLISENDTIRDNDTVTISATVTNIGIEKANNFDAQFLVDDISIEKETLPELAAGSAIPVVANWTAKVGKHVIKVEADYENLVVETNETNNIAVKPKYVCGAEVSGNTSWETLGLHGDILFEPTQPYDEDEVNITVNLTNYGCLNATNFTMLLFYYHDTPQSWECKYYHRLNKQELVTYQDAEWIYLRIIDRANKDRTNRIWDPMNASNVEVYDAWGNAVLNESNFIDTCRWAQLEEVKSCWIPVEGDTANVSVQGEKFETFNVSFYPIYENETSRLFSGINVPVNSSHNITMKRNVSVGNFTVMAVIDPENRVPEDDKTDNIVSRIMRVNATRDFTVLNVTAAEKPNLLDLDTANITAEVANVGYRNGTTNVRFVDYETETRTYKYHFDKNLNLSYLPIAPNAALLEPGYENLMIIHRPGVDAIELHFNEITVFPAVAFGPPAGKMKVYDENEGEEWSAKGYYSDTNVNILVPGTTAYIFTYRASFDLGGYTTEKEFHEEKNVTLNATVTWNETTGNITAMWSEPQNVTAMWTAYTGNHTIEVTVDQDNKIDERNESNNTFNLPLEVNASRDATIVNITFDPPHPEDGKDVKINATVKNNGTKAATFTVDLWMNYTRDSTLAHVPNADVICEHEDVNRTSYITFLKRENVTLRPGANKNVTATYHNISVLGDPTYDVIAIVDPLDVIDEMNESDNELRKEIMMKYPELIVASFISPSREDKNASVSIKNAGPENATNVTVRFEVTEYEEIEEEGKRGYRQLKKEGVVNIRVHFKRLNAKDGGWLEIKRNWTDEEPVKRYSGDIFNEWSPWVKGDSLWIFCNLKYDYIIDAWEWGEIVDVPPTNETRTLNATESVPVHIPSQWGDVENYTKPRRLKVTVDPDNNITEQKEGNNNRTGVMYIDLVAEDLRFVSPTADKLWVGVKHNKINATIRNNNETDGIIFPVSDFNVSLMVRDPDNNDEVVFSKSIHYREFQPTNKTLYAGQEEMIEFVVGQIYPDFVGDIGDTKDYTVSIIADSEGVIDEDNDLYPQGEGNNVTSETAEVHKVSGYTGGDLDDVTPIDNRIYGDMIYSIGNSEYDSGDVSFSDVNSQISSNANITSARLYLHWVDWTGHDSPSVDMQFNGEDVSTDREYYDDTVATTFDSRWGTYVYDVTDEVEDVFAHGGNYAASAQEYEDRAHFTGMGLLIVYEDESEPLIEYGIAEGTWTIMADNTGYSTGLLPEQCTANASFAGVVNRSTGRAELLTVLASWNEDNLGAGVTIGDALLFNGGDVGSPRGRSYWEYEGDGCMALTVNHWEDVTDYLSTTQNRVEIQSRGNFMMATNAFFKVTYLPDLTVSLYAPDKVNGGATRKIEATIRNIGEAKAENFRVRFTASDGTPEDAFRTVDLLGPNNKTTVNFTWTAPDELGALELIKIQNVTITVEADSEHNVNEENAYGEGEDNNIATGYIRVTITEKPLKISPRTGTGAGEGGGTGTGTGEGAGEGEGTGTGGTGGEGAVGETGGKAITGYLMKGTIAQSEAGGGGGERGEFSLVKLLIRLAMLAAAVSLVCAGYWYERRRQRHKQ